MPSSPGAYATAPAVTITTTSPLTAAKIGVAYSKTLVATGGGPYTSLTVGTPPTGLSLNAATGVISGTPTVGGSKTFTVKVVGAGGAAATKQFTLNVVTVWITTTALPNGVAKSPYTATLTVGGTGPFTWSVVAGSGSLPTGLSLNSTTGVISGTPTVVAKSTFKVKVVGAGGKSSTKALSITIQAAGTVSILTTSLPGGSVGSAFAATLTATGTGPFTWSLASGTLPAGLTLDPATGAITGTPTAAGTSSFAAKVVGAGGASATKTLSIAVSAPALTITTTALADGTVGSAYAATLAATGTGPFTWSISTGSLPAGLTLVPSTGAISGTPTTAGMSNFTVAVAGAGGSAATKALSIVVAALPSTENWTQSQHDAGNSGYAPGGTVITPTKASSVHQEWSTAEGPTVIDGGKLYTIAFRPANPNQAALLVYDLATGTVTSSRSFTTTECQAATAIATTATLIIANCGNNLMGLDKAAAHVIQWQIADTDPGQSLQGLRVTANLAIGYNSGTVLAYRLTDGTRMWQHFRQPARSPISRPPRRPWSLPMATACAAST
ncbi:MAG TPA: putative Ig domain-containing protein [Tetrasphaera sp.]|uniref:putative Ig domain-containing protein n=1 Tax=Nostocoides sp. TaxID=1917966 RepID=UPI002C3E4182|nr:putative Ig domain-containing protein [Tetrasphaera sp.]HNQ07303.1 putative Ig domain-containing protein [Tetrasphaera sp.]